MSFTSDLKHPRPRRRAKLSNPRGLFLFQTILQILILAGCSACLVHAVTAESNSLAAPFGARIEMNVPRDYQVIQRSSKGHGRIRIAGSLQRSTEKNLKVQARLVVSGKPGRWHKVPLDSNNGRFEAWIKAPVGGWYALELRVMRSGTLVTTERVDHCGVGEVFIVAGQSNSANHGEQKQVCQSRRVSSFDGQHWRLADDPQTGASGDGGSFIPPLGDQLVSTFNVPIGFVPCGIGATSVREWLPKGEGFTNPPTIESRVLKLSDGSWVSGGAAYEMLVKRMQALGPYGFRALLWHQGESDANQRDPSRTLSGALYRKYLEGVIRASQREIRWSAPWFVAQVSYHAPGDESSTDIRDAQAALWRAGVALEGPDSDELKGRFRDQNGLGIHFSGEGLREHAARWAQKIVPWLNRELKRNGH